MSGIDFIFIIAILIMSVVIHEVSHGFAANRLGDPTARYAGRLTLNPLSHLDFIGSFLVPVIGYLTGGIIIGWAKPVPYNPYNLRNARWGEALVAVAGPASNIAIAIFFGLFFRFGGNLPLPISFWEMASLIVFINIILAIFNLIPIPPLDGSKILFAVLPPSLMHIRTSLERYGIIVVLLFIFLLWRFIAPLAGLVFQLITGSNLG